MSENRSTSEPTLLERFEDLAATRRATSPGPSPLSDWPVPGVGRTFRWSIIVVLLALAAALLAGGWWITSIAEMRADGIAEDYRRATGDLQAAVPGAVAVVDVLTDPAATPADIEAAAHTVRTLDEAASALGRRSAEPLPVLPNGIPDEALRDLDPIRDEMALVAARSEAIAQRLGRIVDLRLNGDGMFVLPALPSSADSPETANEVSLALASMVAQTAAILAELPNDAFLDEFESSTEAHLDWIGSTQPAYVAALRRGETATALAAVAELRERTDAVAADLDVALERFQEWFDVEFAALQPALARLAAAVQSL